jgi:hypothetical protein
MTNLRLIDLKNALLNDGRFRDLFPELKSEIIEVLNNPNCACNIPTFRKLLNYKDRLQRYFPNKEIETTEEEIKRISENNWRVINCSVADLEHQLNKLHKYGRKQVAVARWEDQCTIVINELAFI